MKYIIEKILSKYNVDFGYVNVKSIKFLLGVLLMTLKEANFISK